MGLTTRVWPSRDGAAPWRQAGCPLRARDGSATGTGDAARHPRRIRLDDRPSGCAIMTRIPLGALATLPSIRCMRMAGRRPRERLQPLVCIGY